jgi:hypothetical protein
MSALSEAEAKTKWCPFSRVQMFERTSETDNPPVNRHDCNVHCVASYCMAWRWRDSWGTLPKDNWPQNAQDPRGFCGLAGEQ